MHVLSFVGPPGTGKTSLGQLIARALGRPFQRVPTHHSRWRRRRGQDAGSSSGLHCQRTWLTCAKLVVWTQFYYCELSLLSAVRRFDDKNDGRDEIDKVGQSSYHGDPSAALLEVLDPEQNVAFNVRFFTNPSPRACFFSDMDGLLGSLPQRSDRPIPDSVHLHG